MQVYRGLLEHVQPVAIKVIPAGIVGATPRASAETLREITLLRQCRCPHIVQARPSLLYKRLLANVSLRFGVRQRRAGVGLFDFSYFFPQEFRLYCLAALTKKHLLVQGTVRKGNYQVSRQFISYCCMLSVHSQGLWLHLSMDSTRSSWARASWRMAILLS